MDGNKINDVLNLNGMPCVNVLSVIDWTLPIADFQPFAESRPSLPAVSISGGVDSVIAHLQGGSASGRL